MKPKKPKSSDDLTDRVVHNRAQLLIAFFKQKDIKPSAAFSVMVVTCAHIARTTYISKQDFIRHGNLALSLANDELQKKEQPDWFVFFDYLMLMAINYFSEQNLDYIVLETGTS